MSSGNKSANDRPTIGEATWEALALASGIMLFIGMLGAAAWIILAPTLDMVQQRTVIAAPFVTAGAAIVTFCTVTWRGKINERQTNTAQAQLRATEESNLAGLLQKGAELLAESTKRSHIAAGIASLETLVRQADSNFAIPAMNVLADFLEAEHSASHANANAAAAIKTLDIGAKRGFRTSRDLYFQGISAADEDEDMPAPRWLLVTGVRSVRYSGGIVTGAELMQPPDGTVDYHGVHITEADLYDFSCFIGNCTFRFCKIHSFRWDDMQRFYFRNCDFTEAECVGVPSQLRIPYGPDLRLGDNWYEPGRPPRANASINWFEILHEGEPEDALGWL